jgi:hypothetical protein
MTDEGGRVVRGEKRCDAFEVEVGKKQGRSFRRYGEPDGAGDQQTRPCIVKSEDLTSLSMFGDGLTRLRLLGLF